MLVNQSDYDASLREKFKTVEMRVPQENQEECLKAAKTFRLTLYTISVDTGRKPQRDNEKPEVRRVRS